MTLAELKSRANEVFGSIIVFCPDFPASAKTNTEQKFGQLIDIVNSAIEQLEKEDAKQLLRISLNEMQQARKHYDAGDRNSGINAMQRAEQHFKDAFLEKPISTRFVVGPSGTTADTDSGFPE